MDRFEYEDSLKSAGFSGEQARLLLRGLEQHDDQLMTQRDGEMMEKALRGEIQAVRGEMSALRGEMNALGSKLFATAWTVGGAVVAAIVAADHLL